MYLIIVSRPEEQFQIWNGCTIIAAIVATILNASAYPLRRTDVVCHFVSWSCLVKPATIWAGLYSNNVLYMLDRRKVSQAIYSVESLVTAAVMEHNFSLHLHQKIKLLFAPEEHTEWYQIDYLRHSSDRLQITAICGISGAKLELIGGRSGHLLLSQTRAILSWLEGGQMSLGTKQSPVWMNWTYTKSYGLVINFLWLSSLSHAPWLQICTSDWWLNRLYCHFDHYSRERFSYTNRCPTCTTECIGLRDFSLIGHV